MQEVEYNGIKYRTGKLDAFKQFHLFRKLMPLFSGMGETAAMQVMGGETEVNENAVRWAALGPISQAVSEMSQSDSEFILRTCLSVCLRQNPTGQWVKFTAPNGELMFEDLDLMGMLQLTFAVIQDNLGNFFPAQNPNGSGGGTTVSVTNPPI